MRVKKKIGLIVFTTLLVSCVSYDHTLWSDTTDTHVRKVSQPAPHFQYVSHPPQNLSEKPYWISQDNYQISTYSFDSNGNNGQPDNRVEFRYFQSEKQGVKPLLIVLPIWATHTYPPFKVSMEYSERSEGESHVVWLQGEGAIFDWLALWQTETEQDFIDEVNRSSERFSSVVIDIRRLVDWAETRPEIDTSNITVIGFSMGALVAANVVGNDPRLDSGIYVMGGGYPGDMMADCGALVGMVRQHVIDDFGWTEAQYRQFAREAFRGGDPVEWAGQYDPAKTLIVEADEDECMQARSRHDFWVAAGKPEKISLHYNHWQSFLAMTPIGFGVLNESIFDFIDRTLITPPQSSPSENEYIAIQEQEKSPASEKMP